MSDLKARGFTFDPRKYMMVIALVGIWAIFAVISGGTYPPAPQHVQPVPAVGLYRDPGNRDAQRHRAGADRPVGGINRGSLRRDSCHCKCLEGRLSPFSSILITVGAGLFLGLWNGWWIAYRNVPSFIVTMAGLLVFRGILVGITDGITIGPLSPFFGVIGKDFLPTAVAFVLGGVVIVVYLVHAVLRSGQARRGTACSCSRRAARSSRASSSPS